MAVFCSSILLFLTIPSSKADELGAALANLKELQVLLEQDTQYVNVDHPRYAAQSRDCIQKFENSTIAEEVTQRDSCLRALSRGEAEKATRLARITETGASIEKLNQEIAKLRSENAAANSQTGSSNTNGSSSSSSSQSAGIPSASPTPSSTTTQESQELGSGISGNAVAQESLSPTKASESQKATPSQSPNVVSKNQPAAAVAKAQVKKRTITCTKGKTVRKVTAVKPVCPKGFKLKR